MRTDSRHTICLYSSMGTDSRHTLLYADILVWGQIVGILLYADIVVWGQIVGILLYTDILVWGQIVVILLYTHIVVDVCLLYICSHTTICLYSSMRTIHALEEAYIVVWEQIYIVDIRLYTFIVVVWGQYIGRGIRGSVSATACFSSVVCSRQRAFEGVASGVWVVLWDALVQWYAVGSVPLKA